MTRPATVGELRASGWLSRSVKEEMRANAVAKVAAGEPLFDGVYGYENTVLPQLENAVLAGHDVVFLGERGQAKTRMIRSMVELLDEWMPYVAGSEIFDHPFEPSSRFAIDLVAEHGDDTPLAWAHRSERYGEKLATPDTSIADLIGEVDPIKVAEGRYLSDELTLHYGLVPRTNRGIFAINELPDLAERLQVGLLNVLEERDVQVRGYKVRLPLDVMLVASANPEDYTNRGRIITPLKDRFGAQIRTHYPLDVATEIDIAYAEAQELAPEGVDVTVPEFMSEVVARFSHVARSSPDVNQRSGVSVRMTVANLETLCANATRRALQRGETSVAPRVSDLGALMSSTQGKIEIESLEEGRDGDIVARMLSKAVLDTFSAAFGVEPPKRGSKPLPRSRRQEPSGNGAPVDETSPGRGRFNDGVTGSERTVGDTAANDGGASEQTEACTGESAAEAPADEPLPTDPAELLVRVVQSFGDGNTAQTGDDLSADSYAEMLAANPALAASAAVLTSEESPAVLASAAELVLEGLHLSKRLNKDSSGARATYRAKR